MQLPEFDLYLGLKEKIALVGFIVILISIPITFTLVKNTQIFKSSAFEQELEEKDSKERIIGALPSPGPKEIPDTSPLSELESLIKNTSTASSILSPTPGSSTPTPTPEVNLAFGPILNIKVQIEGRPAGKQAGKAFVGLSSGTAKANPSYLLTFTIDFPDSGEFKGLSLAGLNPGSVYTAYVKGAAQIDSASTFTMGATETKLNNGQPLNLVTGDLNEDNTINSADYTLAKSLYGTTKSSSNWNLRADFNLDGVINNLDLSYILKNFGKTGASNTWYSPPPQASGSGTPSGYWLWVP